MKNYQLIVLIILINVLLAGRAPALQKKPAWIIQRPVSSEYYIGIGAASKTEGNLDYRQIAKESALQDLSSEITVNISSEIVVKMMESSDAFEEELKSQIRATTQANLEGYELVDNWEDDAYYWVYYRLPKAVYAKNKADRIKKARDLGANLLKQARNRENQNDPAAAMGLYVQALQSIEEFIGEPLKTEFAGSTVYLQNEIFNNMQNLLSNLNLSIPKEQLNATVGRAVDSPLSVRVTFMDDKPAENIPLYFRFIKGEGELINEVRTDDAGVAVSRITNIYSTDNLQIVNVRVVPVSEVVLDEHPLTAKLLDGLSVPSDRYVLNVSGITCFIETKENIMDAPAGMNYVEPKLKKILAEQGFTFTDNLANADILINLEVLARQGAQVYNLYSSFADMNISITNLDTGQEVYKNSFSGIKGIQLDYDKAGIEALKNAGKKIDEIAPELISRLK